MVDAGKVFKTKLITIKNASRVNVLQLLECCIIIQTMPFNSVMNVNYD